MPFVARAPGFDHPAAVAVSTSIMCRYISEGRVCDAELDLDGSASVCSHLPTPGLGGSNLGFVLKLFAVFLMLHNLYLLLTVLTGDL